MIYVSDINKIISEWVSKLRNNTYPAAYKDALYDCCYDLDNLVKKALDEEIKSEEAFQKWMEDIHHAA